MRVVTRFGFGIKDLARVYKLCKILFTKRLVMTMIAITGSQRVCEYKLSTEIRNLSMKKLSVVEKEEHLLRSSLSLFNKILMRPTSNDEVWRSIDSALKQEYNINLKHGEINQSLLRIGVAEVMGLQYNLEFSLGIPDTLARKDIIKFVPTVLTSDIDWTPFYQSLRSILSCPQDKAFEKITQVLELRSRKLPSHARNCSFEEEIVCLLSPIHPVDQ